MQDAKFETIDPQRRRVVVLANRKAGTGGRSGELVQDLLTQLKQRNLTAELHFDQATFAQSVHSDNRQDLRCVVAAGGDGTAGFAANRMSASTPLMLFPLGTENLMSKYLNLPREPDQAAQLIDEGLTLELDAGMVNDQLFLIMLGCGFDADVVQRMHRSRKGNINRFSYAKPIFESIFRYKYPKLKVSCWNGEDCQVITAHWVFIFNVPSYAAGLGLCPEALPNDGLLDASTFRGGSILHGMYHLSAVMLRRHQRLGEYKHARGTKITIESVAPEVAYQIDGDPGGILPVELTVAPKRLKYIVSHALQQKFSCNQ